MNDFQNYKMASDLLDRAEYEIRTNIERDPFRIFNVFEVLSVQYKEVIMCRMLKDLLDPKGKHGKGNKFLKLFFKVINESSGEIVSDEDLDKSYKSNEIVVDCEHEIDDNRRIDILIRVGARYIPIEVKIYAGEQQNQVQDYLNYCNKMQKQDGSNDKTVLLYLTLDGHNPSAYSVGCKISNESAVPCSEYIEQDCSNEDSIQHEELKEKTKSKDSTKFIDQDKTIIPISFKDEICRFLEQCIKEADNESLFSNLKQYLYAIETISGKASTPVKEALVAKLDSKAAFKAVKALDEALVARKTKFLNSLFEQLESNLRKFIVEHQPKNLIEIDLDSKDGASSINTSNRSYITEDNILSPYKGKTLMENKTSVADYYSCSGKVFPSIIFLIGKVKFEQKIFDLAVAFEIEDRPYVGIMLISKKNDGKYYRCNVSHDYHELGEKLKEKLSKIAYLKSFNQENWMLDWRYVSAYGEKYIEKTNDVPIFSNCNDAYFEILESVDKKTLFFENSMRTLMFYLDSCTRKS